jgi:hypothetical protein
VSAALNRGLSIAKLRDCETGAGIARPTFPTWLDGTRMTDFPHDLIMGGSPSLTGFYATDIGVAASRAIERHADDLLRAADAGEPPVMVLKPAVDKMICEGLYWRMVERMIAERLGSSGYEKAGSKLVPIGFHRRARCYRRIATS